MRDLTCYNRPFIIAGPCVIESEEHCLKLARELAKINARSSFDVIFKASFDKANRSRWNSYRGPGLRDGLDILQLVRAATYLPVTTDVHTVDQVTTVAQVVDLLQVPALLSRQTDLIVACACSGKPINVKKGQFLSPESVKHIANKIQMVTAHIPTSRVNHRDQLMFTERGVCFGYDRLVLDMTAIPIMQFTTGCPIVVDVSHCTKRAMIPSLAKAAIAAGADGLFIEVHDNPDEAKCDGASSLHIDDLEDLLKTCYTIYCVDRNE